MKNTIKRMVLVMTLFASAVGFAASNLDLHPAVRDALNDDPVLLYAYWGAQADGYVLEDSIVHPIYYVVAPVGDHDDCTVELTLDKAGEHMTITVQILDDGDGNLRVGDITVDREVVE